MKRFLLLTLIGAFAAGAIVIAANVVGEWLIAPWKYGNGSAILGTLGVAIVYVGVVISLPARLLTFGSESLLVSIAAAVGGFGLWGAVFAIIFERLTLRSSSRPSGAGTLRKRRAP